MKRIIPIIPLFVLLTGCPTNSPVVTPAVTVEVKVATALNVVSQACQDATRTILAIYPDNTQDRRDVLNVIAQIVKLNVQARKTLEAVSKNPLATPADVVGAMKPLVFGIQASLSQGLLGIKNPEVKQRATEVLLAIQVGLTVAQGILEVTYGS